MLETNIALYIGAPIEEESERSVLSALLTTLAERAIPAVVFANLHVGGRQLDFVVGTSQLTLVVEAKTSTYPLRGQYNGDWVAITRAGKKPFRNAYQQALQATYAMRDAMRAHDNSLSGYPRACVVFTPTLPAGSDLPESDYKVSLCDLGELPTQIDQGSVMRWSPEHWHRFAEVNGLQRVADAKSALDARLLDAQRTLDRYSGAFAATYAPVIARYVPDSYRMAGQDCTLQDVEASLVHDREDLLIRGPSGCGKSLLSFCLANRLLSVGVIPLIVECKSFDGQLSTSLDREAALLDMRSAMYLIAAARSLSRSIAVVVDGYNECPTASRVQLTRALRAVSVKYDAIVLITSQTDIERSDLLQLRQVNVVPPSNELKVKIANVDPSVDASLVPLLETVTTGIEANLVGQIGREISMSSSRFALFDFFVRRKLGDSASDVIRLLCAVAERLMYRVTFSLSLREVDRLHVEASLHTSTLLRSLKSGVLIVRGDRVSFCHEMYLNTFAAESINRKVGADAEAILAALSMPRYRAVRAFLIGTIDDESLLAKVLGGTSDGDLLEACLTGECGSAARRFVSSVLATLPARLEEEAGRLRFKVVANHWWNVEVAAESLTPWSEHDNALLSVLAVEVAEGRWVKEVLSAVKRMDATLAEEFRRLRPEAVEKRVRIHSGLFAVAFMFGQGKIGLTRLVSILHSGTLSLRRARSSALPVALELLWQEASSSGTLYFALALSRVEYNIRSSFAHYALPFLQRERWRFLPYHVQLDLLDFAHALHEVPDHIRDGLADALQELLPDLHPSMTQTALEALSGLGVLQEDEDQHVTQVRQQIRDLLNSATSEHAPGIAWGIYYSQFDHPFSSAYVQAIEELLTQERLSILRLACAGADGGPFFISSIFDELARAGDLLAAPAILRWTQLPAQQTSMPQLSIEVFIKAFVALGRLAIDLPAEVCRYGRGAREDGLVACGLLYYWIQRRDPDSVLGEAQAASALDELLRPDRAVAVGILYEISESMFDSKEHSTALVHAFPEQVLAICRAALERPDLQTGYFDRQPFMDQAAISNFAIDVVGLYGSVSDLTQLRLLIDNPKVASKALEAVKVIEGREASFGVSL